MGRCVNIQSLSLTVSALFLSTNVYSANNIEILSGSAQVNITGSPSFTSTDDTAQLGIDNITSIWDASISNTVTLSTAELGTNSQSGDITFTGGLSHTDSVMHFLNLNAHNDINLNGTIDGGYSYTGYNSVYGYNNGLVLTLNPDSDALNGGVVNLNGSISGNVHTTINGALEIGATGTYNLDNHYLSASLTVESINVANGGSFNFTSGNLTLTNSDLTIGVGGLLGENFAIETNSGKKLTLANNGVLNIDAGASFSLQGFGMEVGSIVNNGNFSYTDGDLTLTNSGLTIGVDGLLGNTFTLAGFQNLVLSNNNILTIDAGASFTQWSGYLKVGSIVNNGSFTYNSGVLALTNSALTIGTNGLLGDNIVLKNRSLSVSGDVTVEAGASLLVSNSSIYGNAQANENRFFSNLNNQGTVTVNSTSSSSYKGELTVDGIITNDGASAVLTLDGGALIAGIITNVNGGSFNFNSGQLSLTNSGLTVGSAGVLGDNIDLSTADSLTVANNINIDNGATLSVNGGSLSAGAITNSGNFTFNTGRLELTNSGMTVGGAGLLGDNVTLGSPRTLSVVGNVVVDNAAVLTIDSAASFLSNLDNRGTVSVITNNTTYAQVNFDGRLTVDGVITNDGVGASLLLDRGVLTAGGINNVNGGSFAFGLGYLALTNSGLTVGNGGLLGDNVTLDAKRVLSVAGDVVVDSGATLTLDSSFSSSYYDTRFFGNLNNQGSVSVINIDSKSFNASGELIVDGVITNDGAAASLILDNGVLTAGSIQNINGASFNFNSGVLELTNSGLMVGSGGLLGDNVTLATRSRILLAAGDVAVANGASLIVDSAAAYVRASNGRINKFSSNLDNQGSVSIVDTADSNAQYYGGKGQLIVDGVITNNGASASLLLDGGALIAGNINNINGGSFTFNSGYLELTNSGLTVGSGGMLGNNVALSSARSLSLASDITIDSGATLTLDGGRLTAGSINNTNGGNFNFNSGDLVLTRSAAIGTGGPLGNTVALLSDRRLFLANSNVVDSTLTVEAGASFVLNGGTLVAGDISNSGNFSFNSGVLGLTKRSSITIGAGGLLGSNVELSANRKLLLGLANNYGTVTDNSVAIGGAVDSIVANSSNLVINDGSVNVSDGGQLVVSGDVSNFAGVNIASGGNVIVSGNVSNNGYGRVDIASGGALTIDSGLGYSYTQTQGTLTTNVDGVLNADDVFILGGTLTGSGVINGNLTIDGGEYNPGNSPGTMEIVGDFVLTEAGTLQLEAALDVNGNLAWDQLIVGGTYDFQQNGTIQFSLIDGVDINSFGADFTMANFFRTGTASDNIAVDISAASTIFDTVDILAYDAVGSSWYSLAFDGSGVFTATEFTVPPSTVPVPAAVWLFGSGLLGLMGVARRKKR